LLHKRQTSFGLAGVRDEKRWKERGGIRQEKERGCNFYNPKIFRPNAACALTIFSVVNGMQKSIV